MGIGVMPFLRYLLHRHTNVGRCNTFHMEGYDVSVLHQEKVGYLWWFGL